MTDQKQIEKLIESALKAKDLDWEVALVALNPATHCWDVEFEVPDGPEVLLSIPQGDADDMKKFIKQQIDEEIERVDSHKH